MTLQADPAQEPVRPVGPSRAAWEGKCYCDPNRRDQGGDWVGSNPPAAKPRDEEWAVR